MMKAQVKAMAAASLLVLAGTAAADVVTAADRICEGHVSSVGIPWHFPNGRINWLFNPTEHEGAYTVEWTVQLNRMGIWNTLAKAYRETKNEKYARCFAQQVADWLEQTGGIPPEKDYNRGTSPFRTIEEGIRSASSWLLAWRTFASSPAFTPELKQRYFDSWRAQAQHLMRHHSAADNWLFMEMNGAYAFAAEFPELPESAKTRKDAAELLYREFLRQMLPDGMHYELTPDYHSVVMHCSAELYLTAKEKGFLAELPEGFGPLIERGGEAALSLVTPAFSLPRFNDCYTVYAANILSYAAKFFPEREDFRWGLTYGREGKPPTGKTASKLLPYAGFAAMRSDWGSEATYLAFDFGPLGFRHEHQDKLSFTLWKGNEELIFEDGGGAYERSEYRSYALSGYDHNVLMVDGLVQNRNEPRVCKEPIDCGWVSNDKFDFAMGVYDQGYGPKRERLARHERRIGFEKPDRFRLQDVVTSSDGKAHDYALLFHVDSMDTVISPEGTAVRVRYGRKWDLILKVLEGGTVFAASAQTAPRLSGWYVGRGDKTVHPATTIQVRSPKPVKDHRFVITLTPVPAKGR